LLFGAEGPGIRPELLAQASNILAIEQFGSTRSLNVGVAAGIAMYAWLQQNRLV
jgi:tRNA G18 (ribose-2'-O)-methylase SpoU